MCVCDVMWFTRVCGVIHCMCVCVITCVMSCSSCVCVMSCGSCVCVASYTQDAIDELQSNLLHMCVSCHMVHVRVCRDVVHVCV